MSFLWARRSEIFSVDDSPEESDQLQDLATALESNRRNTRCLDVKCIMQERGLLDLFMVWYGTIRRNDFCSRVIRVLYFGIL